NRTHDFPTPCALVPHPLTRGTTTATTTTASATATATASAATTGSARRTSSGRRGERTPSAEIHSQDRAVRRIGRDADLTRVVHQHVKAHTPAGGLRVQIALDRLDPAVVQARPGF